MQTHEQKRTRANRGGKEHVSKVCPTESDEHRGSGPSGNTQVIDTVIHQSTDYVAVWRELGRAACREGRKLADCPFGTASLSVEGERRLQAYEKGWSEEALQIKCPIPSSTATVAG